MGLSIVIGGSIIFIALLFIIFNIPILLNSIYSVAETSSLNSELDDKILKTDTKLQELIAFSGSNVVNFDLLNEGNEKLWDYDKFNVIITYDAYTGGTTPTRVTEQFTYDRTNAFDSSVVNGTSDFRIQRGTSIIPGGSATTTITEGVGNDFMMCQGDCFIKLVNSRNSGQGRTDAGEARDHEDFTTYISGIAGLTTKGDTITFERNEADAENNRVTWEIWEYIGETDGDDEMTVLDSGVCNFLGGPGDLTCNGAAIAGGATDDSDVVVIITGLANPEANDTNPQRCMVTSSWDSGNNWPVFTRTEASNVCDVSYAVVEWTGSNWAAQRIEHTFTGATPQTEPLVTSVGDTSRAFFHTQQRNGGANNADDAEHLGSEVELINPTTIEYRLPQSTTGWGGNMIAVTWVISNSNDVDEGEQLIVNHYDPAERTDAGPCCPEEDNWQVTLNPTLTYPVNGTAITGMSGQSAENNSNAPQGFLNARLTDSSTVDFWRSEEADNDEYTFQTTEFPRKFSCLSDNPGLNLNPSEWTINYIIDDNLDPEILNSNECASISAKLSNPIFSGGILIITISTDNAVVSSQSQTIP